MSSRSGRESNERLSVVLSNRLALRPKEAAAVLGISDRTLRNLLPEIPHFRRGGVVLIPKVALETWLAQQATVATVDSGEVDDILSKLKGQTP